MTVKVQFLLLPPEGRRSLLRRRLNQNRPGSNKDNVRWVGFSRPGPGEAILYKQKDVRVLPKEAWDPYSEERVQHAWCVGFLGLLPGGDMIENATCSFLSATGNTRKCHVWLLELMLWPAVFRARQRTIDTDLQDACAREFPGVSFVILFYTKGKCLWQLCLAHLPACLRG